MSACLEMRLGSGNVLLPLLAVDKLREAVQHDLTLEQERVGPTVSIVKWPSQIRHDQGKRYHQHHNSNSLSQRTLDEVSPTRTGTFP